MSTAATSAVSGTTGQQTTTGRNAFNDVNLETFIKLLVTELQSQDPLNPMDNSELINQVSQIRSIESNQRLTETLQSVLLGQNMATASSMLGRTINGLDDGSKEVRGKVDRVSVADGVPRLHVGEDTVQLKNVREVLPEGA
jgi:flagellar basal-body rod modification protein FlgD